MSWRQGNEGYGEARQGSTLMMEYYSRLSSLDADKLAAAIKRKVVGQDAFIDSFVPYLCLALRCRLELIAGADEDSLPRLSSAFIVGPTASGKTHALKVICKEVGIECQFVDCSSLTGAGWRGNSVDNELRKLAKSQKRAPGAITLMIWDEADKMHIDSRVATDHSFNAQHTLLKPLDGGVYSMQSDGGKTESVDMDFVLHVFAGAFTGIEDVVADRLRGGAAALGFSGEVCSASSGKDIARLRNEIQVSDFVEWGMMPELCGRCGAIFNMPALTESDLSLVMKGAEFSLESKFAKLMAHQCDFQIEPEAVDAIVQSVRGSNLGVRALESELAPVVAKASEEARRQGAGELSITADGGTLAWKLGPGKEGRPGDGGCVSPCGRGGWTKSRWSTVRTAVEQGDGKGMVDYVSRTLDELFSQFDLDYFTRSDYGIAETSRVLAERLVSDDESLGAMYRQRRVAKMVGALTRSMRLRGEGGCTLGKLYREAVYASNSEEYFEEFTSRALLLDSVCGDEDASEWNTMIADLRQLKRDTGGDFSQIARSISTYLVSLASNGEFQELKEAIYEAYQPRADIRCS